ncbi:MAG: hypothetical protein ABI629_02925 [bacterium]
MSETRGTRATALRVVLAAVVVIDLLSFVYFIDSERAAATATGTLTPLAEWLSRRACVVPVALVGGLAGLGFGRRAGRLWEGLIALVALGLLSTAHAQVFGSPWRHLFYSGLCLAGWLLGLAVTRRRGRPMDESYACIGSVALLSAAYFNAGISKMVFTGSAWLSGVPIQAAVVSQDGLIADSLLSSYRAWAVSTPLVAILFSVATVGFELAGPLMLVGRRMRALVALGLIAMHANILLMTHILYWESMVFLVAFGFFAEGPVAERDVDLPGADSQPRTYYAIVALLILCAAGAIAHQAQRFARVESAKAEMSSHPAANAPPAARPQPPPTATPTRPLLERLGPFRRGQRLNTGWTVVGLDVSGEGIVATLSGPAGAAAFEVTCAASEQRSPFDTPSAHIFYTSDVAFADLDATGQAVRAVVQQAAAEDELCARVSAWRVAGLAPHQ